MQTDDEYFDSTEFRDILAAYEESVSSGAPIFLDTDDLIDIADYYTFYGYKDKAAAAVDAALDLAPGAVLPLVYKAREALTAGDVEAARRYSSEINDKEDPDYKFLQAEIMVACDLIDKADRYLDLLFEDTEEEEKENFKYDTANMYLEYGVYDKALEWIERCEDFMDCDVMDIRGRSLLGLERYDDCVSTYNTLLDYNPRSVKYWATLANAQFMKEDYSEALSSSEFALALDPKDAGCMMIKANSLCRLGNFETALEFYRRYNKAMPNDACGELNMGKCLMQMERYEEALAHLRRAAVLGDSTDESLMSDTFETLAFAYSALGDPDSAVRYIDKAFDAEGNPDNPELFVMRGHILLENGRHGEARSMFRHAAIKSGYSPKVILRIIVSLLDNGYTKRAYIMFKLFFKYAGSDFSDAYSYMALCCWQLKKGREFLKYLRKAVGHNPQEAKSVLGGIIPADMTAEEFLKDITDKLNIERK